MNINLKSAIAFILISAALAFKSDNIGAYICLGAGIALYGFLVWSDRVKKDEFSRIDGELESLKNKVQAIQLNKSIGRG